MGPTVYVVAFLLSLSVIPMLTESHVVIDVLFFTLLYAFLSTAWNIQSGFCGQYSVGHAAFLGIGAYTTAILYTRMGISPWLGLWVGAGMAALFALAIGFPTFRLRGYYYILATLAVAEVLRTFFLAWDFTGRSLGIAYPLTRDSFWDLQFHTSRAPYFYIMLAFLICSVLISHWIRYSKFGLNLLSIREDEDAAQSLGINPFRHKMAATALSAGLTGIGGALLAQFNLFIEPDTLMSLHVSADILLPSLVGGIGTVWGPVAGSFILQPLSWFLRLGLGSDVIHIIIRGILLMVIVAIIPRGVVATVIEKYVRPRLIKR